MIYTLVVLKLEFLLTQVLIYFFTGAEGGGVVTGTGVGVFCLGASVKISYDNIICIYSCYM
jgi:hypothetical protein